MLIKSAQIEQKFPQKIIQTINSNIKSAQSHGKCASIPKSTPNSKLFPDLFRLFFVF